MLTNKTKKPPKALALLILILTAVAANKFRGAVSGPTLPRVLFPCVTTQLADIYDFLFSYSVFQLRTHLVHVCVDPPSHWMAGHQHPDRPPDLQHLGPTVSSHNDTLAYIS